MDVSGELAAAGAMGARALITAMTTDGWERTRSWFGRWLGRGSAEEEQHQLARLDRDRQALCSAEPDTRAVRAEALMGAWEVRVTDLTEVDPEAARLLLEMVRQWSAEHPEAPSAPRVVKQTAKASGHGRTVQVGGNQITIRPERG